MNVRWGEKTPRRGIRKGTRLIRPSMVIEDPPERLDIEIDWCYVAECAQRIPGKWLRVDVGVPGWTAPSNGHLNVAPIRRNDIKSITRSGALYVRYDPPSD